MNKIYKALSVAAVLYGFALAVLAGQKDNGLTKADILFAKGKPTIYITYENSGKINPRATKIAADSTGQEAQRHIGNEDGIQIVRLRLHNNTRWAINFSTDSLYIGPNITPLRLSDGRSALGLRDGIEVNVRYEIEPERGAEFVEAPVFNRSDMFSTSWLPPGRSVIFIVPREHLSKNLKVYVPFTYEWETTERDYGIKEPEHRVYFRSSDLPEIAR